MRKVILITKGPHKSPLRDREWDVYRNRYPPEGERGFIKSILGIGNEYSKLDTFESRERAIEYGLQIAAPDEEVTAELKRGGQTTVREPRNRS